MNNIMIDIETMGTKPDSCIVSIAAVKFNFENDEVETFYKDISIASSKKHGMTIDPDTVSWWMAQSATAREFTKSNNPLETVVDEFIEFIGDARYTKFWANGMNLDFPTLEWSFRAVGRSVPWRYWNLRDCRTIYSLFDVDMRTYPRIGQYHNSLDDCHTQIHALKHCLLE